MSALGAPLAAQSTREALGGTWATSLTVWVALLIPALALSAYQNIGDPFPSMLAAVIACVTPCVAVGLVFLVGGLLRRSTSTMSITSCIVFWAAVGSVHGLTAELLSTVLSGTAPHLPAQTIYWAGSCLIWLPLVTYVISQSVYRRKLLAALAVETQRSAFLRRASLREIADLRSLIVSAIQENIRPVLIEIEHSLEALVPALNSERLADLGQQLAGVSEETARIINTTEAERQTEPPAAVDPIVAPVVAALDFDQTRPLMAAGLSAVALLPLVIAVSFRSATVDVNGIRLAAIILVVVAVLLAAGLWGQRLVHQLGQSARVTSTLAAYTVAGLAAAAVSVLGPWQPANHQNLVLALFLPIAVPLAAVTLSAAVGIGNANLGAVSQIADVRDALSRFEGARELDRRDIRDQVSALTHGPLRGRLAACAMALNFHAAEIATSDPARTEHIVASVREHLADVLTELDTLG